VHTNARILEVRPGRIREELRAGFVVVAAGFQGISREGEVTTLGRGGSDTSAVALAAALGADACEIYTDVSGVFSADPRRVGDVHQLARLDHQEMKEMAWHGARVLKAEAVEFARDNGIEIGVGSSHDGTIGTWVGAKEQDPVEPWTPQRGAVSGVAGREDLLRIEAVQGLSRPELTRLLSVIGRYDLVFGSLPSPAAPWTLYISQDEVPEIGAFAAEVGSLSDHRVRVSGPFGGVSLVGFGLGSRPQALSDAALVLEGSSVASLDSWTSRESLSFVVPLESVGMAVMAFHRTFVEEGRSELKGARTA
jgi:aspartate kinase